MSPAAGQEFLKDAQQQLSPAVVLLHPPEMESALVYRICPTGRIHDKIYRPSIESRVSGMRNLTLLSDGTYLGQIRSQDRLVIVSIDEKPESF